jgi:hypothetical protein
MSRSSDTPLTDLRTTFAELDRVLAKLHPVHGCQAVLIGTTRQGALYHLIKGHFQRRLEAVLPPEIPVKVLVPEPNAPPSPADLAAPVPGL